MMTSKKINTLFIFLLLMLLSNSLKAQSPNDNFYKRSLHKEKRTLSYNQVHERDVFWEKRVWREIIVDEKMNHAFKNEKMPLINILLEAARAQKIAAYSAIDDQFSERLSEEEVQNLGVTIDTVIICFGDFEDFNSLEPQVVRNELNPGDVKKFRLKEVWYFDEATSQMNVRILGIAPIISRYDDNGNYLNEGPMFWAYYPELRSVLAQHEVANAFNDATAMTWDDLFEARLFSSYITKQSNAFNNRIKDVKKSPMAALLEADKIKNTHLNMEHDLWSY